MKKLAIALTFVLSIVCCLGAQARDTYSRDVKDLPAAAQSFLKNNFKAGVSLIKIDKTMGHVKDYEVILTDGSEVEFDGSGNWKEIDVPRGKSVPDSVLPALTKSYIKQNHNGQKVVGIERSRSGFSVDLTDGIELKVDKTGAFIRYDD